MRADSPQEKNMLANGLRYPLVGGRRQRHFAGTNSKPHKLPENAQTPTSRVHALLAGVFAYQKFDFRKGLTLLLHGV